jgi:hypothetical protein
MAFKKKKKAQAHAQAQAQLAKEEAPSTVVK